jgi:hypothetical protein
MIAEEKPLEPPAARPPDAAEAMTNNATRNAHKHNISTRSPSATFRFSPMIATWQGLALHLPPLYVSAAMLLLHPPLCPGGILSRDRLVGASRMMRVHPTLEGHLHPQNARGPGRFTGGPHKAMICILVVSGRPETISRRRHHGQMWPVRIRWLSRPHTHHACNASGLPSVLFSRAHDDGRHITNSSGKKAT